MRQKRFSESRSKTFKALWKDPTFRLKRSKSLEKVRKQISETFKKKWKDKKFHEKMCKIRKKQANKESALIRNSNALKRFWANPKNKARMIESRSKKPKYLNRHKQVSETLKRKYANGEIKVWNKGLTKETHNGLKKASDKLKGRIPVYNTKGKFIYLNRNGSAIEMRSSWEVTFAYWLDKLGIKWKYEPVNFNIGKGKWCGITYTPDFYLDKLDIYIEVKGYASKEFLRKLKRFRKKHPSKKLFVLYANDYKFVKHFDKEMSRS